MNFLLLVLAYFHTISLIFSGVAVETTDYPNRWERGKLLEPVIPENPFIKSYHIANNGTHTYISYEVTIPPFGHYRTGWHRVSNQEWEEFDEWLNTPRFPTSGGTEA